MKRICPEKSLKQGYAYERDLVNDPSKDVQMRVAVNTDTWLDPTHDSPSFVVWLPPRIPTVVICESDPRGRGCRSCKTNFGQNVNGEREHEVTLSADDLCRFVRNARYYKKAPKGGFILCFGLRQDIKWAAPKPFFPSKPKIFRFSARNVIY